MNTTELVHFVHTGTRPPCSPGRAKLTPSYHELVGPARQAIVRARHGLLNLQAQDGSWRDTRHGDASLESHFIFLQAYLAEDIAALDNKSETLCESILARTIPGGGWSRIPGGEADLSLSVQAYFAVKLGGHDASDERLAAARDVIRRLGGADMADATTRLLLGAFGQVPGDLLVGMSVDESRSIAKRIGAERGVRELFLRKPAEWAARGAVPFFEDDHSPRAELLDFQELVLWRILLHARGARGSNAEVLRCEERLRELTSVDEGVQRWEAHGGAKALSATAGALVALSASGMSLGHEAVARAANWLRAPDRRREWTGETLDLVALVELLGAAAGEPDAESVLPPDLHVVLAHSRKRTARRGRGESLARGAAVLRNTLTRQILAKQNCDGGWGSGSDSSPDVTGAVLAAVAKRQIGCAQMAIGRGIAYLRQAQRADGSWDSAHGVRLVHGTSLGVCGLISAGVAVEDDAVAGGVNWLVVHQSSSGAWGEVAVANCADESNDEFAPGEATAMQTAWGLAALVATGREATAGARRAVAYLLESQEEGGAWYDRAFVLRNPATLRWYRDDTAGLTIPLMAISNWLVAAEKREATKPTRATLRLFRAD